MHVQTHPDTGIQQHIDLCNTFLMFTRMYRTPSYHNTSQMYLKVKHNNLFTNSGFLISTVHSPRVQHQFRKKLIYTNGQMLSPFHLASPQIIFIGCTGFTTSGQGRHFAILVIQCLTFRLLSLSSHYQRHQIQRQLQWGWHYSNTDCLMM